jgi:hypothetical protein
MKKLLVLSILLFSLFSSLQAESAPTISMTDIKGKTYQITGTDQGLKIKGLEGKIVFHISLNYKKSIKTNWQLLL